LTILSIEGLQKNIPLSYERDFSLFVILLLVDICCIRNLVLVCLVSLASHHFAFICTTMTFNSAFLAVLILEHLAFLGAFIAECFAQFA